MGRIAAPFGVKGWVKVQPLTALARNLLDYPVWWVERDGGWDRHEVTAAKVQTENAVVAQLAGCVDREAAAAFRGRSIAVPRSELPPTQAGEHYWADLIGLVVVNGQSQELGRITGILQTGANDVLVVEGERERMIPFIAGVVREVDMPAGAVRVEWDPDY
jgi:16S rRNA processing protein RimM